MVAVWWWGEVGVRKKRKKFAAPIERCSSVFEIMF